MARTTFITQSLITALGCFLLGTLLGGLVFANGTAAGLRITVSDTANAPIKHAVLGLYPLSANARDVLQFTNTTSTIDQVNKRFIPQTLAVPAGTAISFPNNDRVRHHVYSFSPAKRFELELYSGVPTEPVVFDQPGLVILGCNIHDQMVGYVYVLDTPLTKQTQADGAAAFENLPAGRYRLQLWHANGGSQPIINQEISLAANQTLTLDLTLKYN